MINDPGEGSYTDQTLERLKFDTGLETVQAASIGVYHYKVVEGGQSFSTCTIVSRGGPKVETFYSHHLSLFLSFHCCVCVCVCDRERERHNYCLMFQNHTIYVTDQGFEPKVVTIHPGDRIWWVWQEGTKQHNIIQVNINTHTYTHHNKSRYLYNVRLYYFSGLK